jgi:hypothetical protein
MILSNEIKEKLQILNTEVDKVEDFVNFKIFGLDAIEDGQIGYSMDPGGKYLVSDEEGSWKSEWIVVGYEILCGDPIIIDTKEIGFPVSSLIHGMGDWDGGIYLSESLDKFINAIRKLNKFIDEKACINSVPRITCDDLDNLLNKIIKEDKYGDLENWKSMLNPIYESTQEYEDTLTRKINKLSEEGMKINEISIRLNMSVKDAYRYLRRKSEE